MIVEARIPVPSAAALDRIADLVQGLIGVRVTADRREALVRAAEHALVRTGARDFAELATLLQRPDQNEQLQTLAIALTVGETHFFRNRPQFEALREVILPELIRRRATSRRLRIWSAGCATGEEPYSIAMLVLDLLPDVARWDVSILGTDVDTDALARAREGVFGPWSFRQVRLAAVRRFFTPCGEHLRIAHSVAELVRFEALNLVAGAGEMARLGLVDLDLIVCRNVLIYFDEPTVRAVVGDLGRALAHDGWLLAGHAETPMPAFRDRLIAHQVGSVVAFGPAGATLEPPVCDDEEPAEPVLAGDISADEPDRLGEARDLWQRGLRDPALELLSRVADAAPADPRSLLVAARLLGDAGRVDDALAACAVALERCPELPDAHHLLGVLHRAAGDDVTAQAAFRRCMYLDPEHVLAHVALANMYAVNGDHARASRLLESVGVLLAGRAAGELLDEGVTVADVRELAGSHLRFGDVS